MNNSVIEVSNVDFSYNGERVLEHVNLSVNQGNFLVVLGPNGGGKTTLIKLILGLLHPTRGTVRVFGKEPRVEGGKFGPRIGYVPQHANLQQRFPITVEDVTLMGLARKGGVGFRFGKKDRNLAHAALEKVGGVKFAHKRFDELSGGQQQRVLVARALIGKPELLVLDEPTANIDPQGKVCLFELMAQLGDAITIVVVSHDMIIASTKMTDIAVVNKQLIYDKATSLTPEMLALIYGEHDATCPMGDFLQGVPTFLEQTPGPSVS